MMDDIELVDLPTHLDMLVINVDIFMSCIVSLFKFMDGLIKFEQ